MKKKGKHDMFYKVFFWIVIFYLLIDSLMLDDTDKDIFHKSDLKLHTDYGTGVQYLSTWTGYMIPRRNANGEIINIYRKDGNENRKRD